MNDRFTSNWTTQIRKGLLELCILNSIDSNRLYGYDIVKRLRKVEGLVISEGTIYPILTRLRREDLLETTLEESTQGPARKYYELTDRGRTLVEHMNRHWNRLKTGVETLRKETS